MTRDEGRVPPVGKTDVRSIVDRRRSYRLVVGVKGHNLTLSVDERETMTALFLFFFSEYRKKSETERDMEFCAETA